MVELDEHEIYMMYVVLDNGCQIYQHQSHILQWENQLTAMGQIKLPGQFPIVHNALHVGGGRLQVHNPSSHAACLQILVLGACQVNSS